MRHLAAFADHALLQLHEIPDPRASLHMALRPQPRKRACNHFGIDPALRYHTVRLNRHVVAEHGIEQHAARFDRASRPKLRFSQQLHARLNHGVFTRDHVRIDQHRFRQLNRRAIVHHFVALPFAERPVHSRQLCACVATQRLSRIRRNFRQHRLPIRVQHANGIGQVNLPVFVVGLHLRQRRPQLRHREAIDARIDFVQFALLRGQLRLLNNRRHRVPGFPQNSPVARRIGQHRRQYRRRRFSFLVLVDQRAQRLRSHQRRISRQNHHVLRVADRPFRHQERVARALLRLLDHGFHFVWRDNLRHLFRLVADHRDCFFRA